MCDLTEKEVELTPADNLKARIYHRLGPWLTGSAMAAGQALLATGCSVPRIGQCVGCGSCAVAVATLSGWALKHRQHNRKLAEQGIEPFEVRARNEL